MFACFKILCERIMVIIIAHSNMKYEKPECENFGLKYQESLILILICKYLEVYMIPEKNYPLNKSKLKSSIDVYLLRHVSTHANKHGLNPLSN